MLKFNFIFILLIVALTTSIAKLAVAAPLKKITVMDTNNSPDNLLVGNWVSETTDIPYLHSLKSYIESKGFRSGSLTELEFVKSAMNWVTAQWKHDGMNIAPESFRALEILKSVHNDKARYRCVEYGIVLTELLQSYGFVARTVGLRSNDVGYGGFGQGHVAMEVWINDLKKWIFLDPQFGVFITTPESSEPLNYYEIYQQKNNSKWDSLKVHVLDNSILKVNSPENPEAEYKNFLKEYFAFMTVSSSKKNETVSLLMESREQPLTFQGAQSDNLIFTRKVDLLYPEVNRVVLLLSYRDPLPDFPKLVKDLKIETNEDYLKHMSAFAAKPRYHVTIKSSGLSAGEEFEYRISNEGQWIKLEGNTFDWDAMEPMNRLEVRSVNIFARRGPITFIDLKYE